MGIAMKWYGQGEGKMLEALVGWKDNDQVKGEKVDGQITEKYRVFLMLLSKHQRRLGGPTSAGSSRVQGSRLKVHIRTWRVTAACACSCLELFQLTLTIT